MKPRLPFLPADLDQPAEVVAAIRARRGGVLTLLDRQLLHSPPLAMGWNQMLGSVRRDLQLPAHLRELAMCGVAILNGAEYEYFHHAPIYVKCGASQAQADALRDIERAAADEALFDPLSRAVLQMTIEMTRTVKVSDSTFAKARELLGSDQLMFELITTIAAYNMVSRVLVAIGITPGDEAPAPS